jgi:hypothetical protein
MTTPRFRAIPTHERALSGVGGYVRQIAGNRPWLTLDGYWPEAPEEIGADDTLRLESTAVAFPLRAAYAQTHLA